MIRLAAVLYAVLGLGFGAATVVTLSHLDRHGELPMTPWGFRSLSGPFEQLGQQRFTALGWALVAVCVLDVIAGRWLWQGRRRGPCSAWPRLRRRSSWAPDSPCPSSWRASRFGWLWSWPDGELR